METRYSFEFKHLLILFFLAAIFSAGMTLLIFFLGQQSGLRLAGGLETPGVGGQAGGGAITASPTMPPLPQAMTATPRPAQSESFIFTEEMLDQALKEQSGGDTPILVERVKITSQDVEMNGQIDYLGYQGALSASAVPYVAERKLRVKITSLVLDGQNLPQLLYPAIEEQVNAYFDQALAGYDVQSVELTEGQITVVVVAW